MSVKLCGGLSMVSVLRCEDLNMRSFRLIKANSFMLVEKPIIMYDKYNENYGSELSRVIIQLYVTVNYIIITLLSYEKKGKKLATK